MKKILGIVASNRRLGNCEILVKEIARRVSIPHELRLLRLPDFDLRYCTGCYRCLSSGSGCILDDDLAQVLEAVVGADALILAAPTYFLGAHSSLKIFLDRAISFYCMGDRLWGKPAVGVGVAGMEGKEGSTHLDIERFLAVILAENLQTRILYGALPGEVLLKEENRNAVAEMAAAISGDPSKKREGCCPICAGETFRFLEGSKARCMLCSHAGEVSLKNGRFTFSPEPIAHPILFGKQNALDHRDWLEGMKKLFRQKAKELRQVTAGYEDDGEWIMPEPRRPV
ncbi:flavodoxin family protein [Geoalkalibacter halelectricus]|uniref:Flavodoxin family protein n=1 Tax=Geoalkalibacter halelectricus TaxID=2847045 RepID=A0ABY5ZL12_9BACT|nr:flavodoxin family protein [Geoalkalibacter halelectricus]MDO3380272.1 flavodoxin family protein [Geoalkalibacter halelectricus]UWZ79539.1 flavodoxin family protein [Geoalkalibacter halelectricus]